MRAAASTLWKEIGREKGLAAANATFGLTGTTGGTKGRWGATTTTTADQLRLLQVVFTDASPLTPAARTYVQTLMGGVASGTAVLFGTPVTIEPAATVHDADDAVAEVGA